MLYEAYFDETGDHRGFPIMAVGGYLIKAENARQLEPEWNEILAKYGAPFFHMVEVAHGTKNFKAMSRDKRIRFQKDLFAIINKHVEIAFCCATPLHRYQRESINNHAPYTFCLNHGLLALQSFIEQKHGKDFELSVYYEAGHADSSEASRVFAEDTSLGFKPKLSFITKTASGMIQAADALVWQYGKFLKDFTGSMDKAIRADFKALMQIPGMFYNLIPTNDSYIITNLYNDHLNGSTNPKTSEDLLFAREIYSERLSTPALMKSVEDRIIRM